MNTIVRFRLLSKISLGVSCVVDLGKRLKMEKDSRRKSRESVNVHMDLTCEGCGITTPSIQKLFNSLDRKR